jgi:hypothetical protein
MTPEPYERKLQRREGLANVILVDVVLDLSDDDRELGFLAGVVRVGVDRGSLIDGGTRYVP